MKRSRPTVLPIGSISTGTLRTEDLLDAFTWAASHLRLSRDERAIVREAQAFLRSHPSDVPSSWAHWEDEEGGELVTDLEDVLRAHTPDYCYFGAHEGDGADIGVWVSWDTLEEDRRFGDLPDADSLPRAYTGFAIDVNDHGNVTLYRYTNGRSRVVWAVV